MPARYYYRYQRPCRCFGSLKDVTCWGKGGYEGFLDRLELALPTEGVCQVYHRTPHPRKQSTTWLLPVLKPCGCFARRADEKCWGKGGYAAFLRGVVERFTAYDRAQQVGKAAGKAAPGGPRPAGLTQAERDREQAETSRRYLELERKAQAAKQRYEALHRKETASRPRQAAPPVGAELKLPPKPPPARQELKADPPSKNATWIPGYWHRGTARWHWIGGWWRVPTADVKAGLTARATRTPPPVRRETVRPAPPAPDAVWVPGYWHWHGSRYVWIGGRWRIPPARGQRWRPARWRPVRGGAIFLPGGWIIRVP